MQRALAGASTSVCVDDKAMHSLQSWCAALSRGDSSAAHSAAAALCCRDTRAGRAAEACRITWQTADGTRVVDGVQRGELLRTALLRRTLAAQQQLAID